MSDLKIRWDTDLMEGDLVWDDNDLQLDQGLATAVLISLFTDRRATVDDELPDSDSTDRRGFWGDQVLPARVGEQMGSRLWLLERSKSWDEVEGLAEEYTLEALQWMIDDGIVSQIDIDIEAQPREGSADDLAIKITLHKDEENKENFLFNYEWGNT
jgi:phage gp46-like protein